jgi:hypothetical protein
MPALIEYESGNASHIDNVQVRNISLGGVLLTTNHEFSVGSDVDLNLLDLEQNFAAKLGIPENASYFIRLKLSGRVLRNERTENGNYGIALEFSSPVRIITQAGETGSHTNE